MIKTNVDLHDVKVEPMVWKGEYVPMQDNNFLIVKYITGDQIGFWRSNYEWSICRTSNSNDMGEYPQLFTLYFKSNREPVVSVYFKEIANYWEISTKLKSWGFDMTEWDKFAEEEHARVADGGGLGYVPTKLKKITAHDFIGGATPFVEFTGKLEFAKNTACIVLYDRFDTYLGTLVEEETKELYEILKCHFDKKACPSG